MGGHCSKTSSLHTPNSNFNANFELKPNSSVVSESKRESIEKQSNEVKMKEQSLYSNSGSGAVDDFYDGIPRYPSLKSRSIRSVAKDSEEVSSRLSKASTVGLGKVVKVSEERSSRLSKASTVGLGKAVEVSEEVSSRLSKASTVGLGKAVEVSEEVSSRLSKASTVGLGKAVEVSEEVSSRLSIASTVGLGIVEVLDTLGSSMTNLNKNSGFAAGVVTKGNKISILAFEVANTIVKGSSLMNSLSKRSITHLKEVVLPSEFVQNLVSTDMDELLRIFAADKREELKIFSEEVVRYGRLCKDPQWQQLERYFEKFNREMASQTQLKEKVESVMELLMTLVGHTAELYHECQVLDRIEQDYQRKWQEEEDKGVAYQRGDSLGILRSELKSQKKLVRNLKKKSLWPRNLEEIMEKLVDVVRYLFVEINNSFGSVDDDVSVVKTVSRNIRLGPAGLSLHYANVVLQIDALVARSTSMPPNTRDALYQSLPPNIKAVLLYRLQSFHVKKELTITEIKDEMEKTLQWLVPISTNTAKAHHSFGWVGEWANSGSDTNRKPAAGSADIIRIETLHHADKGKTEAYILELVLWLNHLANKAKSLVNGFSMKAAVKSPIIALPQMSSQLPKNGTLDILSLSFEDQKMLQDVSKKSRKESISKPHDFDTEKTRLRKHDRLSKSSNY